MRKEKVFFTSEKNVLAANLFLPEKKRKPTGLLFLHGGGTATKERYNDVQTFLSEKGYVSFAFDFQGVGESEGDFSDGSLNNRLVDANNAFAVFRKYVSSIVVVGCSMGGHVAARLSEQVAIAGLIFLYSAAYAEQAEDKKLNNEFTESIRHNEKWKTSPVFSALRKYTGNVLIMYGSNDDVVPKGVQTMYSSSALGPRRTVIVPDGPHLLFTQEASRKAVYNEIKSFLHTI